MEDLELPDRCVALVVGFYGEVDRDSFKLAEVQQELKVQLVHKAMQDKTVKMVLMV